MASSGLQGRDLFMRNTSADGKTYVSAHRVWNSDLFVAARTQEASREALKGIDNGSVPGKNKVEQITAEQFAAERGI